MFYVILFTCRSPVASSEPRLGKHSEDDVSDAAVLPGFTVGQNRQAHVKESSQFRFVLLHTFDLCCHLLSSFCQYGSQ